MSDVELVLAQKKSPAESAQEAFSQRMERASFAEEIADISSTRELIMGKKLTLHDQVHFLDSRLRKGVNKASHALLRMSASAKTDPKTVIANAAKALQTAGVDIN